MSSFVSRNDRDSGIVATMTRVCSVLALAVAFSVVVGPTRAEAQNPLVERGQSQYDELRYEEALQTLSAALVRAGNTRDDLAVIYRLLAYTYLALGREEEAAGGYRSLLAIEPDAQAGGDLSPRFREFFDSVKQQWEADGRPGLPMPSPVTITHRSPAQADRGQAIALECQVEDPSGRVASIVLAYRHGTDDVFRRVDTERHGASYVATIPGDSVAPPLVEYYFEGLDATGLPVAARGDVAAPLRVAVPEPGENVLETWWFWVGVGVIVAGAATVGILAATGAFDTTADQGTFLITVR